MAKRYITLPKANSWDNPNASDYLAKTILEMENQPRESGLLDAGGNKLFSSVAKSPVGFLRFKEG